MNAQPARFLTFLKSAPQLEVPIYQRTYSWRPREWEQVWHDLITSGQDDSVDAHFFGSVVYIQTGLYLVSDDKAVLVIDGQQRLATVTVLLEVLARALGDAEPVDGFSASKIRNRYLVDPDESGDAKFKLLMTDTDRESWKAVVQGWEWPSKHSVLLKQCFEYFSEKVGGLGGDFVDLCNGLNKLVVVDMALDRNKDNPQLIFEGMNSTGRALSQADHIRNFVLMGLEVDDQAELYQRYWRRMEVDFGQEAYATYFDRFMRHYLTFQTGSIPREREVYEAFRHYSRKFGVGREGAEALLSEVWRFSTYYCAMALGAETDGALSSAFRDLRELRVDVAYPLLLQMYWDYDEGRISRDDFLAAVRLVESYVFRRAVCSIPTNSLNKTFATIGTGLEKTRYLESLQGELMSFPSYRRFPRDEEFIKDLKVRDLYKFPRLSYWLRRIENHDRKEYVPVDEYTVEHVIPQNSKLSEEWQSDLGPDWRRVQREWLHTLGNLTLTGYNSEYSDRPFWKKRDMKGGFHDSPLRLNEDLRTAPTWDEQAVQKRAERLAAFAVEVWSVPSGLSEPASVPGSAAGLQGQYSIDDHAYLEPGQLGRSLFDALSVEITCLDPCVDEVFNKQYVSYKAETNFVDVVPLASGLNLYLNVDIHELVDPRRLAEDVSGVGHWGIGDVRVHLTDLEQLVPVMALVRQSLETQLGESTDLERRIDEASLLGVAD